MKSLNCISVAALLVDMTRTDSFKNLGEWVNFLKKQTTDIPFVIAGNKEDLVKEGGDFVSSDEATEYAYQVGSQFYPTSALTGSNVDLVFRQVEIEAVEQYKSHGPSEHQMMVTVNEDVEVKPSSGCCN